MDNLANITPCLEILISTMNKTSLTFLKEMFVRNENKEYKILVINQTSEGNLLTSNDENIRVINSFETGLPQSRNLALQNAIGDICLIADDDVVYEQDFEKTIIESYKENKSADIITFMMIDAEGELFRNYPINSVHDKKSVSTANSVVITFNREKVLSNEVWFNNNFGLGSVFQTANEYVFLRNALDKKLNTFFKPKIILSHPVLSSGKDASSDRIIFARGALFYKYSGLLGYLRVFKYVYLLYRTKQIKKEDFFRKTRMGLNGINKYRQLVKEGLEIRKI